MAKLRDICYSYKKHLEEKLDADYSSYRLTPYNFNSTGQQGGIRIEGSVDNGKAITGETVSMMVGRMFPVTDNDHFEARIVGYEVSGSIKRETISWGDRCAKGVSSVGNFSQDAPIIELAKSSSFKLTDTLAPTVEKKLPSLIPSIPAVQSTHYVIVIVKFTFDYLPN
jgi:hypothetical protein